MKQEQTWNRCKLSGKEECTHKHEEPIRKLVNDKAEVSPPSDPMILRRDSISAYMMAEANAICKSCEAFQA